MLPEGFVEDKNGLGLLDPECSAKCFELLLGRIGHGTFHLECGEGHPFARRIHELEPEDAFLPD